MSSTFFKSAHVTSADRGAIEGLGLYQAIAIALIDALSSHGKINESAAALLLQCYKKHFPQIKNAAAQESALNQWKTMISPLGAAANLSMRLTSIVVTLVLEYFSKNPAQYAHTLDGQSLIDANVLTTNETTHKYLILSLCAEVLALNINYQETKGVGSIPAVYRIGGIPPHAKPLELVFNNETHRYLVFVSHPERYQSIQKQAPSDPTNVAIRSLSKAFLQAYYEWVNRYKVMLEAGELNEKKLLQEYTVHCIGKNLPQIPPNAAHTQTVEPFLDALIQRIACAKALTSLVQVMTHEKEQDLPHTPNP